MPKRIVDGDALWTSTKLEQVSPKHRGEYAWILPLSNANGVFDCNPKLVWRTCYSQVREDWAVADVTAMLDDFVAAKMLFRWKVDEKTYGFFIGAQKEGRLPSPSLREKNAKAWQTNMVPEKELASFLGVTVKNVRESYPTVLQTNSRVSRDQLQKESVTGNGIGSGSGMGQGMGYGICLGDGVPVSKPITPITADDTTFNPTTQNFSTQSQHLPRSVEGWVDLFQSALEHNPNAAPFKPEWKKFWKEDFTALLKLVSPEELFDILAVSQMEKNQMYYVRTKTVVDKLGLLQDMVRERDKAMSAIRAEFKTKLSQPDEGTAFNLDEEDDDLV